MDRENLSLNGPQAPTGQCRKGFPAPLSSRTYQEEGNLRCTYKRVSETDQWVVPYNAKLLLLWEGHCNVQYCTGTGLASYISKYVTKAEPKSLLNVQSSNHTTSHILARRMVCSLNGCRRGHERTGAMQIQNQQMQGRLKTMRTARENCSMTTNKTYH